MGYTHYWSYAHEHPTFQAAFLPWVADVQRLLEQAKSEGIKLGNGTGEGKPEVGEGGVIFNGWAADDEDYETFAIQLPPVPGLIRDGGFVWDFCKTSGDRPYDAVVCAALIRLKVLAGDAVAIDSDGGYNGDWDDGKALYKRTFGEPAPRASVFSKRSSTEGPAILQGAAT